MISVKLVRIDTKALDHLRSQLGANFDEALLSAAFQIEGEAKILSPVRTGALKNSIHVEKIQKEQYIIGDGVEYGIYQELGTSRMAARPFLVPAFEKVINYINNLIKGVFD